MATDRICKHCGHTIMKAGGLWFHTGNGFSHTCKICGCWFPETDEHHAEGI